jgi:hypothetical protein
MLPWKESENGAGVPIPIAVIEVTRVGIIAVHHLLDEAQTERAFSSPLKNVESSAFSVFLSSNSWGDRLVVSAVG